MAAIELGRAVVAAAAGLGAKLRLVCWGMIGPLKGHLSLYYSPRAKDVTSARSNERQASPAHPRPKVIRLHSNTTKTLKWKDAWLVTFAGLGLSRNL